MTLEHVARAIMSRISSACNWPFNKKLHGPFVQGDFYGVSQFREPSLAVTLCINAKEEQDKRLL